jgi:hypothetical protein
LEILNHLKKMDSNFHFHRSLSLLWETCVRRYRSGQQSPSDFLTESELKTLRQSGLGVMDLFDYVEDFCGGGDPDRDTFLMVAGIRRAYFLIEQKGVFSTREMKESELPGRQESFGGITWLPRIIAKAEAKLKGEMESSIMYGCGGDRAFLRDLDIHPADFLQAVWLYSGDLQKILEWIKLSAKKM